MNPRVVTLTILACGLTSCVTHTEHYFTGNITNSEETFSLDRSPSPLVSQRSTPDTEEWRYLMPEPQVVLLLRAPRQKSYTGYHLTTPSNCFGVFLRQEACNPSGGVEVETPLVGWALLQSVYGDNFKMDASSSDAAMEASGRMFSKRHWEFRPFLTLAMLTGWGLNSKVSKVTPRDAEDPAMKQNAVTSTISDSDTALLRAARSALPDGLSEKEVKEILAAGLWNSNRTAVAISFKRPAASAVFLCFRKSDGEYLTVDVSAVENGNLGKLGTADRTVYERIETAPVKWLPREDGCLQLLIRTHVWKLGQRYTVSEPLVIRADGGVVWR